MTSTSNFTRNGGLSKQTLALWKDVGEHPRSVADRVRFYLAYFQEIVPSGIHVHHITSGEWKNTKHEIQFSVGTDKIFMAGLVYMNEKNGANVEKLVADEGYTKLRDEEMVTDHGSWRFFTAGPEVRMYLVHPNKEYELLVVFHPIDYAADLAANLQWQYNIMKSKQPPARRSLDGVSEVW